MSIKHEPKGNQALIFSLDLPAIGVDSNLSRSKRGRMRRIIADYTGVQ